MYEKIMVPLDGSELAECVHPHPVMGWIRVESLRLSEIKQQTTHEVKIWTTLNSTHAMGLKS